MWIRLEWPDIGSSELYTIERDQILIVVWMYPSVIKTRDFIKWTLIILCLVKASRILRNTWENRHDWWRELCVIVKIIKSIRACSTSTEKRKTDSCTVVRCDERRVRCRCVMIGKTKITKQNNPERLGNSPQGPPESLWVYPISCFGFYHSKPRLVLIGRTAPGLVTRGVRM